MTLFLASHLLVSSGIIAEINLAVLRLSFCRGFNNTDDFIIREYIQNSIAKKEPGDEKTDLVFIENPLD